MAKKKTTTKKKSGLKRAAAAAAAVLGGAGLLAAAFTAKHHRQVQNVRARETPYRIGAEMGYEFGHHTRIRSSQPVVRGHAAPAA